MLTEIVKCKCFLIRTGYVFQLHFGLRTFGGKGGNMPEAKDAAAVRALEHVSKRFKPTFVLLAGVTLSSFVVF